MRILQIVNQAIRSNRIDGDTGYATYINSLTDEFERLGHECLFIHLSYPVSWNESEWLRNHSRKTGYDSVHKNEKLYEHTVIGDNTLGNAMWDIANTCDMVVVHTTTSVPNNFYVKFTQLVKIKLISVVHDPAFCNVTYGNTASEHSFSSWNENYLFKDLSHWWHVKEVFASWFGGKYPSKTKQSDLRKLFENHRLLFSKCDAVVCPSRQVKHLLKQLRLKGEIKVLPHPIPRMNRNRRPNMKKVVSVLSWEKVDWVRTFDVALIDSTREYHLICSEFRKEKIISRYKNEIPSNIKLVPYMKRQEFLDYLVYENIGQCIHLTKIFETFAFVPYEMSEIGIRTIMLDNGSATETAIKANALQEFKVGDSVNYMDILIQLGKPWEAWRQDLIQPPMRMKEYAEQFLQLGPV